MIDSFQAIKNSPITCIVAVLTLVGFVGFQPADIQIFETLSAPPSVFLYPIKLIMASFLHVNTYHLLSNLAIWVIGGVYIESVIGSRRLLGSALLATFIGGTLETLWVDPNFVGLSAACYGVIGVIIWQNFAADKAAQGLAKGLAVAVLFIIGDTFFNWVASSQQIAYTAHIGGLIGGFMAGLLSSLGLGKGGGQGPNRVLRPMEDRDIKPILEIIYEHDEDDGEEAEAAFEKTLADKYVMEFEGRVMGMTGFRPDPDTQHAAWLSFTYIHDYFRKKGNAYWMLLELREILVADNIERLFIATSDYIDEDTGEDIYLAARNFYENKLNADREIKVDDFYAPGESKYVYSLPVGDRSPVKQQPAETANARFVGLDEASESDTSYVALWEDVPANEGLPPSRLETKPLSALIDEVKSYGGKALFVTLPDYISERQSKDLRAAGFREIGTIRDYFAKNVGEVHWGLYFD